MRRERVRMSVCIAVSTSASVLMFVRVSQYVYRHMCVVRVPHVCATTFVRIPCSCHAHVMFSLDTLDDRYVHFHRRVLPDTFDAFKDVSR